MSCGGTEALHGGLKVLAEHSPCGKRSRLRCVAGTRLSCAALVLSSHSLGHGGGQEALLHLHACPGEQGSGYRRPIYLSLERGVFLEQLTFSSSSSN